MCIITYTKLHHFGFSMIISFCSANAKSIKIGNIMITLFIVIKNNKIFNSMLLI
jgi:hypothetical protein